MSRSKKPVVAVAIFLAVLMLLPLVIWMLAKLADSGAVVSSEPRVSEAGPAATGFTDFDLNQLADKTAKLLEEDLAEALKRGDISLEFVADLKKQADRARSDLRNGKLQRAEERFEGVLAAAEAKLAAIAAADKARALKDSTYAELQRLDYLQASFENTYREAVESYNKALNALNSGAFLQAVDAFEMAGAILGDLEARAIQQTAGLLEAGQKALEAYELAPAREAFNAVLKLDSANEAATRGLTMVSALEGIAEEIKTIRELEADGRLEEALAALEPLATEHPNNPFIKNQRSSLEKRILERDFEKLIERSVAAEKAGDLGAAIVDLEAALKLKADAAQQARLTQLQQKYKSTRLEMLLSDGFEALKDARYEAARNMYKEAVALDPNSKEARTGLEKASSLYLANVRYSQIIAGVERYIEKGRYPLAAKLFNQALASRPDTLASAQREKEQRIRQTLKAQSEEVPVVIESDGRTYVSVIGVLPPERFKQMELKLFPDVYKIRGTRRGYKDVEKEIAVDADKGAQTVTVECSEKI